MIATEVKPITFPARPMSGGSMDRKPLMLPGSWSFSPKVNGWRALVHGPTRQMWNRHGQPLTIADEFAEALDRLEELSAVSFVDWWDCEALERRHNIGQGCLMVLDWVPTNPTLHPAYINRHQFISNHLPELDLSFSVAEFPRLSLPPVVSPAVWNDLKQINRSLGVEFYEGLGLRLFWLEISFT